MKAAERSDLKPIMEIGGHAALSLGKKKKKHKKHRFGLNIYAFPTVIHEYL